MSTDWKKKYEDQVAITDSLKRDLAHLQAHTIMPCPAADKMGIHACENQHECWEPCGVMGNDERFVAVAAPDEVRRMAVSDAPVLTDKVIQEPEPLMLPLRPLASRRGRNPDSGARRRRDD